MAKSKVETPPVSSSAVMSLPQPALRNAEEYLKAYTGYAYTAISSIAQEVASIDLHLYKTKFVRGKPESQEIYEHEALSLLAYINPLTTLYDMLEATQIYLELTGEAFWVVLKDGKTPRECWLLRPDWIKIVPSKEDVIDHYTYFPGGSMTEKVDIPKENIIHFKYFNPMNPYRGKGSVQAAALPLDIHTFAQEYNRNFFFNSALPNMVFTSDKNVPDKIVQRFMNQWQAAYGGRSKSNKVAFLGNGLKIDKISSGGKEMDFTEQQRMMRDDILAVFKVPKSILGLTEDVNKANAEATNMAFMERVITPRMIKLVGTINEVLLPMYGEQGLFFDFDNPVPEDVEMELKRYDNALKNSWMTPNEVRAEENLEPIEGGDELIGLIRNTGFGSLLGGGSSETTEPEEEKPTEEKPTEEEGKGFLAFLRKVFTKEELKEVLKPHKKKVIRHTKPVKHMMRAPVKRLEDLKREKLTSALVGPITEFIGEMLQHKGEDKLGIKESKRKNVKKQKDTIVFTEEAKTAWWKQFIQVVTQRQEELRNTAVRIFDEQEHLVMDNLDNTVKHWRKEVRKGKAGSAVPSVEELNKLWNVVWDIAIREIYIEQGDYVLSFLGVGGHIDITTQFAVAYLREYSATLIKGINETTREKLMNTLADGFDNEESIDELKKRVQETFQQASTTRAKAIADTEAMRASNSATVEAYRQSGVVSGKEWLTERDENTCSFCDSLDGEVMGLNSDFFKAGENVEAGGQTLKIGDLNVGEPPLHTNCRCTTIPVLIGGE